MAALRHKLAAVQRELANATEEEYSRLAARSAAAVAAPAGGLQLTVNVDHLVRELQQQQQQHAPVVVQVRTLEWRGWCGAQQCCGIGRAAPRTTQLPASSFGPAYAAAQHHVLFVDGACTTELFQAAPPHKPGRKLPVFSHRHCPHLPLPPQAPPPEVAQNIVPLNLKPLDKTTIRPEGTGEEVLLQGFNWDRCEGGF